MMDNNYAYIGFWKRALAMLIDTVIFLFLVTPLLYMAYGDRVFESEELVLGPVDFLLNWVAPLVGTILFWVKKAATPGKMAIDIKVVDMETGENLDYFKAFIRYIAYIISILPLGLGFIWVAVHPKKRGWHDILSGSVVVKAQPSDQEKQQNSSEPVSG